MSISIDCPPSYTQQTIPVTLLVSILTNKMLSSAATKFTTPFTNKHKLLCCGKKDVNAGRTSQKARGSRNVPRTRSPSQTTAGSVFT
jgi:hypothetical protein